MAGEARAGRIAHVDALDGARGMAVAGVVMFHGGHLLGGYLGVDFFFTLSGFLITSLLLAEAGRTGSVGLGGFWARRARRLLPALAVLMVGVAVYSWAFATPQQLGQIRGDALATLAYSANWREVFSHQNYFAIFSAPSPLNHTWSLAIEEQFYVVWPLVFVALLARFKRDAPKAVLVTSLGLAAVSAGLMIGLYRSTDTNRLYYGTDTRAAAILLGAALAAWLAVRGPTRERSRRIVLEVVAWCGVAVLAIAWTRLDGQSATLYRGGFLACGLAATAIIATIVHPEPLLLSRALSWKPLCGLGLISYAVYLYHWPLDVFLDSQRVGISGWPLLAVQTAVTLAVAVASYRLIEQPVRHGALDAVQWRKLVPTGAIVLVLLLLAGTAGARSDPVSAALERHPLSAATRAYRQAPAGAERVMIVGDSVAIYLGEAFKAMAARPPIAVFNAGIAGCVFPPQLHRPAATFLGTRIPGVPCDPGWEAGAVARFRPDVVFWIVSPGQSGTLGGKPVAACSPAYLSLYRQSLTREVSALSRPGTKVVVVTAAYDRAFGVPNSDRAADCENGVKKQVAPATGAALVDLFSYICPHASGHQLCVVKQHGVTLRPDGLHYQGAGGQIVARWLLSQVR